MLFKVLDENGHSCNGGDATWPLPEDGKPGEWMPAIQELTPCNSGYHLVRAGGLLDWLGPRIWVAEGRGAHVHKDEHVEVYESARLVQATAWNDHKARLLACEYAERVLPLFEKKYPDDKRPRKAIEMAKMYAGGHVSAEGLAAARDAAWDAARDDQNKRLTAMVVR